MTAPVDPTDVNVSALLDVLARMRADIDRVEAGLRAMAGARTVIDPPPALNVRPDRFITIKEAASIARKTAGTVNLWCATYGEEKGFASKIDGRGSWLISENAFRNYLAGRSNHKKS